MVLSCRGPRIGVPCTKESDCDVHCRCDDRFLHHDGLTGVSGTCGGTIEAGAWMCVIDEQGVVKSMIVD